MEEKRIFSRMGLSGCEFCPQKNISKKSSVKCIFLYQNCMGKKLFPKSWGFRNPPTKSIIVHYFPPS